MNGHEVDYCPNCLRPTGNDASATRNEDKPCECEYCGHV